MGWEHTARQKKLAPYGEYRPESYRVVVHDTFLHYRLRMAAQVLGYSSNIPGFLLTCVEYVIAHHREFKVFRRVFRKGFQEIQAASETPLPPNVREPEAERDHRRRAALEHFCAWAHPVLWEETRKEP